MSEKKRKKRLTCAKLLNNIPATEELTSEICESLIMDNDAPMARMNAASSI